MATLLLLFVLGLVIGSFLNSVVYRLETEQQFLSGRSFCPECKHQLAWFDLIPLASFLFLRGHCRYCKKPISWQYPLVELATGLIFASCFLFQFPAADFIFSWPGLAFLLRLIYLLVVSSFLIAIFIFDFKHYLIPDEFIYSAIIIGLLYQSYEIFTFGLTSSFSPLASATGAATGFAAIYLVTKRKGLGFGDVKLAFLMGLFLDFPDIVVALCFAFFSGAILGIVLMLAKKKSLKSELPFGPFLVSGTFFALFFGRQAIDCYLHFLLS